MSTKSERTRIDLINAASKLFLKKGFEQTTFKEIANTVGVTQPLLYSYFQDKMGLLYECCLQAASVGREYIYQFIQEKDSPTKNIYQYLVGNLSWFRADSVHAHIILSMYYFAGSDKNVRKIYDQSQQKATEKILEILKRGAKERLWPAQLLDEKASLIHSLLVGELCKQFYSLEKVTLEEKASSLTKACLRILGSQKSSN